MPKKSQINEYTVVIHPTLLNTKFQRYVSRYAGILHSSLLFVFHIHINIKYKHVTSTYYHSWYLVFEFTFNVIDFHRIIDIYLCVCIVCFKR